MKTPLEQIKELEKKQEVELNQLRASMAYTRKTLVKCFVKGNIVFFDPKNEIEVKSILTNLEPYRTSHEIDHGNKKHYLSSPYEIISNSHIHGQDIIINFYQINDTHIRVLIPLAILSDRFKELFFNYSTRHVNDTEHHYYGGVSMTLINRMRIRTIEFKTRNVLTWYGSSYTLLDVDIINDIISYFKSL